MINSLIEEARKTKDWSKLEKHCLTPEFQNLPYHEKNKYFTTSSKLKDFQKCELTYKLKHLDMIPDPTEDDPDYFIVGRAIDDLLTFGDEYFEENYEVVARRGESNKIQLTRTMAKLVNQMNKEFKANTLFNSVPKKRVFFHEVGGLILKVEMDDYEPGIIRDIKSSSNVITFDPEMYVLQMCMYHWIVEENTGERCKVEVEVVDKYTHFSRSKKIEYTEQTLLSRRGELLQLIDKYKMAHETGIFMRSSQPGVVYNSPYYGHPEYGRWNEIFYF